MTKKQSFWTVFQTVDKGLAEFSPEAKKDVIRFFKDMRLEKTPRPGPIGAETGGIEPRCGSNLGDRAQLDFSPSGGGVGLSRQRGILAKPSLKNGCPLEGCQKS